MTNDLICPQCKQSSRNEDYCPHDGTRLVPLLTEGAGQQSTAAAVPVAETSAAQADDASPDEERAGKISSFFKKFKARPIDKGILGGELDVSDESPSPLPEAVREKGWMLAGPVKSSTSLDRWPVDWTGGSGAPVRGHFHRFRTGALTEDALYRRIQEGGVPCLARVWHHGTTNFGGSRADYELVSLPKPGKLLKEWLKESTASEQRASHLFPLLVEMLRQFEQSGIRPLIIEPDWLQITDNELWLKTAAALTSASAANEYHPVYERSALLPQGWTAPELTQQNLLSGNAVIFSLGQLLAQALWGQPLSLAEIQVGAVPFHAIEDSRLARVLMGCLWPRSSERWTVEQVLQVAPCASLAAMPATPPWESLAPGSAGAAFAFAGASYWRLEDLLSAAIKPKHWDEAIARIEAILDWAEGTAWTGQVALMGKVLKEGRSADWVLVALTRAVLPEISPTWRGLVLSDTEAANSLVGLAQRALREDGAADARRMHELFQADLCGAFGLVPTKD